MPRPSYSAEQNDKIRDEIKAEAMNLFRSDGIEKLSLRKLAERMGMAHTKIYSYYKNKNELHEVMTLEMLHLLKTYLVEMDDEKAEPLIRLRFAAQALLKFARKHSDYYVFMFAVPRSATSARSLGQSTRHSVFDHVVEIARIAHNDGKIDVAPRTLANLSWAMLHGLIMLELNEQLYEGRTLDELAESAIELLFTAKD